MRASSAELVIALMVVGIARFIKFEDKSLFGKYIITIKASVGDPEHLRPGERELAKGKVESLCRMDQAGQNAFGRIVNRKIAVTGHSSFTRGCSVEQPISP